MTLNDGARTPDKIAADAIIADAEAGPQEFFLKLNATGRPIEAQPFPALFEEKVRLFPRNLAVRYESEILDYEQLNERANRLAHVLIDKGIGPENIVGIAVPRSIHMLAAVIAVLKTGAAYLPLDPNYPLNRLQFMIQDAKPVLILAVEQFAARLPESAPIYMLDAPESVETVAQSSVHNPTNSDRRAPLTINNVAYVIYTSGSTGIPKGVMVSHAGIAGLAASQIERFAVEPDSRVLQFASISFDAAFSEICLGLLSGGCLVLAPSARVMPGDALTALIAEADITHITLPPSVLSAVSPFSLANVRCLIVAGEACPAHLVEQWSAGRRMINAYGPTETTVCAMMSESLSGRISPPLGCPNWNTQIHILNASLEPAALDVEGELYIAGSGLARGYLGRPELTAERFIPNPFGEPGSRMYCTGDLAVWRADGTIEYIGRADQQAKIRGFRVEPGEVEAVLASHQSIAQAAVVAQIDQQGQQQLVGFIVARSGETVDTQALRAYLAESLPDYLVPSVIMRLDAFPLTPNGKLDRQALPRAKFDAPESATVPSSIHEQQLAALFAEVLGVDKVGLQDSFFLLGGHSLSATRLISRIRSTLGVALDMDDIFKTPTVAELASRVSDAPIAKARPRIPLRRSVSST